jgi:hypothetical protein
MSHNTNIAQYMSHNTNIAQYMSHNNNIEQHMSHYTNIAQCTSHYITIAQYTKNEENIPCWKIIVLSILPHTIHMNPPPNNFPHHKHR